MIKFFKMLNGEEIVAETENQDEGDWREQLVMHQPYRHVVTDRGCMVVPYPCDSIAVSVNHILFTGNANAELSTAYQQATGGIITPPRGIQLPN